ncbi:MAG: prepilin-type N-terminal cleavage/methylation domain-containing protein [Nitrospirae bacterium]|nr:prepilin-type N-terminal cleavage/methylation domain-containing protein [Nitrospirota bacterium]
MNGKPQSPSAGLTLVEVLVSIVIFSLIAGVLYQVTSLALASWKDRTERETLLSQGQWAMEEMVRHVRETDQVLVPLGDNTPRNILAVAEMILDTNGDGVPDADNDWDGKINEDWPSDITADGAAGIVGIDDDGDGQVDEGNVDDDDEDQGPADEDDDDGDGLIDEDPAGSGVDEDGDGVTDEDPIDPVVFYLDTATKRLIQRLPDCTTTAFNDFVETPIASNVKTFQVTRVTGGSGVLVSMTLVLESSGSSVTLATQALARKYP